MNSIIRAISISLLAGFGLLASVGHATAQTLDVPIFDNCVSDGQAACYATSTVSGLDPNGDGFLAVRSGPATNFPMIDKLYNGEVVEIIEFQGDWRGVRYRGGWKGWAHAKWLTDLAG